MLEKIEEWCLIIIGFGILVGCGILFTFGAYDALYLDPYCLEHGYKESRITWKFDRYCVKRLDQTDVIMPYVKVGRE